MTGWWRERRWLRTLAVWAMPFVLGGSCGLTKDSTEGVILMVGMFLPVLMALGWFGLTRPHATAGSVSVEGGELRVRDESGALAVGKNFDTGMLVPDGLGGARLDLATKRRTHWFLAFSRADEAQSVLDALGLGDAADDGVGVGREVVAAGPLAQHLHPREARHRAQVPHHRHVIGPGRGQDRAVAADRERRGPPTAHVEAGDQLEQRACLVGQRGDQHMRAGRRAGSGADGAEDGCPGHHALRHCRAEGALSAAHPCGAGLLVPGVLGTGGGQRPCVLAAQSHAGRG